VLLLGAGTLLVTELMFWVGSLLGLAVMRGSGLLRWAAVTAVGNSLLGVGAVAFLGVDVLLGNGLPLRADSLLRTGSVLEVDVLLGVKSCLEVDLLFGADSLLGEVFLLEVDVLAVDSLLTTTSSPSGPSGTGAMFGSTVLLGFAVWPNESPFPSPSSASSPSGSPFANTSIS